MPDDAAVFHLDNTPAAFGKTLVVGNDKQGVVVHVSEIFKNIEDHFAVVRVEVSGGLVAH